MKNLVGIWLAGQLAFSSAWSSIERPDRGGLCPVGLAGVEDTDDTWHLARLEEEIYAARANGDPAVLRSAERDYLLLGMRWLNGLLDRGEKIVGDAANRGMWVSELDEIQKSLIPHLDHPLDPNGNLLHQVFARVDELAPERAGELSATLLRAKARYFFFRENRHTDSTLPIAVRAELMELPFFLHKQDVEMRVVAIEAALLRGEAHFAERLFIEIIPRLESRARFYANLMARISPGDDLEVVHFTSATIAALHARVGPRVRMERLAADLVELQEWSERKPGFAGERAIFLYNQDGEIATPAQIDLFSKIARPKIAADLDWYAESYAADPPSVGELAASLLARAGALATPAQRAALENFAR